MTSVTIGNSVAKIGEFAFSESTKIANIGIYNPIPPIIYESTFITYNATLHVPKGASEDYKGATYWGQFTTIIDDLEVSESAVKEIESDINMSAPVQVFNLQGMIMSDSIDDLPAGLYIIRQGRYAKKIVVP